MARILLSFVCVCVIMACEGTCQQEEIKHVSNGEVMREYIGTISRSSIDAVHEVDDSTAIALEFLRMRETIRRDTIGARADSFIGFLSGRLRVTPPKWWVEQFHGGYVYNNRHVDFCSPVVKVPWHVSQQGVRFNGVDYINVVGDEMAIEDNEVKFTLRRRDFEKALEYKRDIWMLEPTGNSDGAVAVSVYKGKFAAAFSCRDDAGRGTGPQRFFYGDVSTGKPEWNAPLLHGSSTGMSSGSPKNTYTEIVIDDTRVFVFSSHCVGMSLQVFDRRAGKCMTIFVTSYLQALSLDESGKPIMIGKEK